MGGEVEEVGELSEEGGEGGREGRKEGRREGVGVEKIVVVVGGRRVWGRRGKREAREGGKEGDGVGNARARSRKTL